MVWLITKELRVYLKRLIKSIFIGYVVCASVGACSTVNALLPVDGEKTMFECNRVEQYKLSKNLLTEGANAILRGEYMEASEYLDDGIRILGDSYVNPDTIDDSGMKLSLANIEESNGNFKVAANLKKKVLESRVHSYELKHECKISD